MRQSILLTLRWVRTFDDMVFIVGAFAVAWQVILGFLLSRGARQPNHTHHSKPKGRQIIML